MPSRCSRPAATMPRMLHNTMVLRKVMKGILRLGDRQECGLSSHDTPMILGGLGRNASTPLTLYADNSIKAGHARAKDVIRPSTTRALAFGVTGGGP
jgi:hypothetical protein